MTKPTYVLGTGLSHNGSACLLKDGKIVVAVEKERITRIKNDGFNDSAAIKYCLDAEGIGWGDIDLVVQNSPSSDFRYGNDWFHGERIIPDGVRVETVSHHLAHAYSTLGMSPFEEAAVFVIDTSGSSAESVGDADIYGEYAHLYLETNSYYRADKSGIAPLFKDYSVLNYPMVADYPAHHLLRNSVGGTYDKVTRHVFGEMSDAGELMGLSAHGDPAMFKDTLFTIIDGSIINHYEWVKKLQLRSKSPEDLKNRFGYFSSLARLVQDELERIIVEALNHRYSLYANDNLCMAGGVAFNIVANRRILEKTKFKNLYVAPPANDAGISIGCAYYGWNSILEKERITHTGSVYLGRTYESEIEEVLGLVKQVATHIKVEKPEKLNALTANLIAKGKVVGWYKGGAEIGPRALGHRSILGNPCDPGMKDHINNTIKNRPDFRPFAPAVLAEDASIYFDIDRPSPYMLMVFDVREEWLGKIPSVTHVDGTARVQTVSESDDKDFYGLLKEVKRETGTGMVLNTSFNRRHEPIVERPQEAVQMFLDTPMDALVLGPYLLTK